MMKKPMLNLSVIALAGMLTFGAQALERIDLSRLVVSVKSGSELPNSDLITKSKHLFGDYYAVYTSDAFELKKVLEESSAIKRVDFNYQAESKELMRPAKEIKSAERNSYFNDPKVGSVWSFVSKEEHGISVYSAYQAYGDMQKEDVIVAVVDTGVDYNHEDLKASMWVNKDEIPGNGIDDDNNGYVDDVHGIDTLERVSGDATGDPMDTHNHGTHVAGTIAAVQNNGIGIAGIASSAKIMAIRTVPNFGDETDVDVAESFLYAARNGARLINCSFGKRVNEGGTLVKDTIKFIGENYGVLVISSAGNDSQNIDTHLKYPASFDNEHMLVIASSTNRGRFSYFSNYGPTNVDVAAPGSSIYSTIRNNRYASYSGTSMASPTTTGMAAELLAINPNLGPLELKKLIMDTVTPKTPMANSMMTSGVVDLKTAIESL